jgi:hypothetical protein
MGDDTNNCSIAQAAAASVLADRCGQGTDVQRLSDSLFKIGDADDTDSAVWVEFRVSQATPFSVQDRMDVTGVIETAMNEAGVGGVRAGDVYCVDRDTVSRCFVRVDRNKLGLGALREIADSLSEFVDGMEKQRSLDDASVVDPSVVAEAAPEAMNNAGGGR